MTPEQFAYWLQGFAEINQKAPNEAQWTIIKDHLTTVFKKVTPGPGIAAPYVPPNWTRPITPVNPNNPMWPTPVYPTTPGTKPEIIC